MDPAIATPQGILGRWYAEPMTPPAARRLLADTEARAERALRRGAPCRLCPLRRLIGRFWLGLAVDEEFERLTGLPALSPHGRILARQAYGQLLMSRRLHGALDHLESAFADAARLYTPTDYFLVMRRNALLRQLPLSAQPHPPQSLEQLLTTARVVAELQQRHPPSRSIPFDETDTFG